MIGLQFIADTFHMEYKTVAGAIGVSKQTFQDWIKERRKIPEPRLEQLSELFEIEDKTLFQKELLPSKKSEILIVYLTKTDKHEEIEVTNVDDEGNKYTSTQRYSQHFNLLEYVQAGQKREKLTEQISVLLNADLISESENFNLLADVVSVLQDQNRNNAADQHFDQVDDYLVWLRSVAGAELDITDNGLDCNASTVARPWHLKEALHPTNWTVTQFMSTLLETAGARIPQSIAKR